MKKIKIVMFAILALFIIVLMGCTQNTQQTGSDDVTVPSVSSEPTPTIETTQIPSRVPVQTPGVAGKIEFKDSKQITVKYSDLNTQEEKEQIYEMPEGSAENAGIEAVNQILFGETRVMVNSITLTDGNLFIDFDQSIYETGLGSSGEETLLTTIADTYLNNVEDVNAVYYSVDGENYSGGHIVQDKDQPFKTR